MKKAKQAKHAKWMLPLVGLALGLAGTAYAAEALPECKPGPQEINGKVAKVDVPKQEITVQNGDGTTVVLKASADTLKEYKTGDPIKATQRCAK